MEHLTLINHAEKKIFHINRFDDFKTIALRETRAGYACLLSPAAAAMMNLKILKNGERGLGNW
jgi:hypothetical protein